MIFKRRPKQEPLPELKPLLKKKKEKGRRSDGRWAIVILFGLTVLASFFFYFKAEAPKVWEKIASPMVISTIPKGEVKFDPGPALEEIKGLTEDLRGTYGVYVYRFDDGHDYGLHEDEIFPAASLIKLPVILTLYRQAEKGEVSLESKYALAEQDKVGGAGILQNKEAQTVYTYRQLAEYMGQYSDNTAFKVIRKLLGDEAIEATVKNLGMTKTSLEENETTPEDIGLLFRKLSRSGVVSTKNRDEILGFLTDTSFEDRIPAGMPEGIRVAHKIGTEIGSFSDAGIVFAPPTGGFVLVIMSKEAREAEAKEILPKIARAVWEFEAEN